MSGPGMAGERHGHAPATYQALDIKVALETSDERYRYIIGLSPMIPWIADDKGLMTDIDARGLAYTGLSYDDCMATGFLAAVHPNDRPFARRVLRQSQSTGQHLDYEIRLRRHDGGYRWNRIRAAPRRTEDGSILRWYGTIEDVHDRKLAEEEIRWAADHDCLTGLWNRGAFMRGLHTALAGARESDIEVALLHIDLDQFKALNDQHGHDAGDAVLEEAARRLDTSRTGDAMSGRLGGDEFAQFVLSADREQLEARISHLKCALAEPYLIDGQAHICRASIGVAIYPEHGDDADGLYKNADLALYEAKNAGCGVRTFQRDMRVGLLARMSQMSIARHALDQNRVTPFYQPKVDLRSGRITGFEALLRWRDDALGMQTPASISAAFADAELAVALDARIFEQLASDIAGWLRADVPFGRIAFNVSSAEFRRDGFADRLLARIERAAIPPSSLELEVTETVFLGKAPERINDTFAMLRAAGLTIALDDFGTGYASLVHLKQFTVDVLKIDCSFIRTLDDPSNAAIVRAIIGLGSDLAITTVAEGVETRQQAACLRRKGCDLGQGFLFSPAVAANQVPLLFARQMQGC